MPFCPTLLDFCGAKISQAVHIMHLLCYEGLNGVSAETTLHLLLKKHMW